MIKYKMNKHNRILFFYANEQIIIVMILLCPQAILGLLVIKGHLSLHKAEPWNSWEVNFMKFYGKKLILII